MEWWMLFSRRFGCRAHPERFDLIFYTGERVFTRVSYHFFRRGAAVFCQWPCIEYTREEIYNGIDWYSYGDLNSLLNLGNVDDRRFLYSWWLNFSELCSLHDRELHDDHKRQGVLDYPEKMYGVLDILNWTDNFGEGKAHMVAINVGSNIFFDCCEKTQIIIFPELVRDFVGPCTYTGISDLRFMLKMDESRQKKLSISKRTNRLTNNQLDENVKSREVSRKLDSYHIMAK